MRTPRPEAFDVNTRQHAPETVDMNGVVPLKPKSTIPPQAQSTCAGQSPNESTREISERESVREFTRTEPRSESRAVVLPLKRRTKRYSFEFYEDQLVKLKQLKIQAEMAGESLSLSDMARAAMDMYLEGKEVIDRTEIRTPGNSFGEPDGRRPPT